MLKPFQELRENFGLFTTGVAIATTSSHKRSFITINSLSSVSLDPALLLFSIDNKSSAFDEFLNNKNFAINILAYDQIDLSKIFSKNDEKDKFDSDSSFFVSELNNLILKNCLGYFECEKERILEAGDHHIIIGNIINFSKVDSDKEPLVYFKGKYKQLS